MTRSSGRQAQRTQSQEYSLGHARALEQHAGPNVEPNLEIERVVIGQFLQVDRDPCGVLLDSRSRGPRPWPSKRRAARKAAREQDTRPLFSPCGVARFAGHVDHHEPPKPKPQATGR